MASNRGDNNEYVRTGAATLEIHIDRKNTTHIAIKRTFLGLQPAKANNHEARTLAMLYCASTSPKVKPASRIIIVEDHMAAKISDEALAALIIAPSEVFRTLKRTTSSGTRNAVMCNGMASLAHKKATHSTRAMQRC
uniref:S.cerevisiae PRP21, SPP91, CDC6, NUC1, CRY2 and S24 genes n=1 Tax=Saccharomyces cerevisiae TaxID=4932 RepID=A2NXN1_YEASX|nr:unnamed protein product [Saccharomyces cerevisiae]